MLRGASAFRIAAVRSSAAMLSTSALHHHRLPTALRGSPIQNSLMNNASFRALPQQAIQFQIASLKTKVTIKTKNYYGGKKSGDDSDSSDDGKSSHHWGTWVPTGRKFGMRKKNDSVSSVVEKFAKMVGNDIVLYIMKELTNTPELRNAVKATAKAVVLGVRKQLQAFADFTLKQIGESPKKEQQKLNKNAGEEEESQSESEHAEQQKRKHEHVHTRYEGTSTVNKPNVYDILGLPRKASPRQILGVSETATIEEVKQAYHTLAKKWHPDTNTHVHANRVFAKIKKNYGILLEEMQRTHPGGFHV